MLAPVDPPAASISLATYDMPAFQPVDFQLRVPPLQDGTANLRVIDGVRLPDWGQVGVTIRGGVAALPDRYLLQAVIHSHGRAPAKVQLAVLDGWGHWTGAVATSSIFNTVVFGRGARGYGGSGERGGSSRRWNSC